MMRWLSLLITVPFSLAVILFAVFNLNPVEVTTFPLPYTITIPLAVLVLAVMAISFLTGGAVVWFFGHAARARARRESKRAAKLEKELAELRMAALKRVDALPASGTRSDLLSA